MTSSQTTLHLVDSIEYVEANCFQHQLAHALGRLPNVRTVQLADLDKQPAGSFSRVACCLKQRTLFKYASALKIWLKDVPVVVYDQDPWQSFMDDSPFKGTYERAQEHLNVESFALTTKFWADLVASKGMPSTFARMWVKPEYCGMTPVYEDRSIPLGFVGSLHPYRKSLFDSLDDLGTQVNVQSGNTLPYRGYLDALSKIRVFIHSEDSPIVCDGVRLNLADGLWIKDVEAAARGCFSIRNRGSGSETYLDGIRTVYLYDDAAEVPSILSAIENMQKNERQSLINESVRFIQQADRWQETAYILSGGQK